MGLTLAIFTIITPTLLGWTDPLGFNGRQRLALKAAGGMIGLGIGIAPLTGLNGVLYLLVLLGLAFGVVWGDTALAARRSCRPAASKDELNEVPDGPRYGHSSVDSGKLPRAAGRAVHPGTSAVPYPVRGRDPRLRE